MFDGVQLVRGGVAALAWKLSLWVVGPRAARDVDVAAAEMAASFKGRRGRRDAIYDDTWREKVCVLRDRENKKGSKWLKKFLQFYIFDTLAAWL